MTGPRQGGTVRACCKEFEFYSVCDRKSLRFSIWGIEKTHFINMCLGMGVGGLNKLCQVALLKKMLVEATGDAYLLLQIEVVWEVETFP